MNYRVHKSKDGRVFICSNDDNDDFVACFKNGKWVDRLVFGAHELDDLLLVTNEQEAKALCQQAQTALSKQIVA